MPQTPALPTDPVLPHICELLCDAVDDGICIQMPDSRIVYANRAFGEVMGLEHDVIMHSTCAEVFNCSHNEDPTACARLRAGLNGQAVSEELLGRRNGQRLRSRVSPLTDDSGRTVAYVTVVRDVTYEVVHEREVARFENMARFGELATGLAHEIKNPLAGIQGAMDILIQRRDDNDAEKLVLENVRREVGRINNTVHMLLDRVRTRTIQRHPASVVATVQSAMSLARTSMPAEKRDLVRLDFSPCVTTLKTMVDAAQIEDAVLNLIQNAIDAIDGAGTVSVSVCDDLTSGELVISVADTGRGIPDSEMQRIFSPFYTTNPKGTGLGLPAVRRIARAHGGRVTVTSEVGAGSKFNIYLPAIPTQ